LTGGGDRDYDDVQYVLTIKEGGVAMPTGVPEPETNPEPATWLLFGPGVVGLVWWRRRRSVEVAAVIDRKNGL